MQFLFFPIAVPLALQGSTQERTGEDWRARRTLQNLDFRDLVDLEEKLFSQLLDAVRGSS